MSEAVVEEPDYAAVAKAAGLRYVDEGAPGITRRKAGKGFGYTGVDGKPIKDAGEVDRIRKLAIPPAYTDVWISPDPRGHIQATGRDARGRKQYRYHPEWAQARAETKFARMSAFGKALPKLRERMDRDLRKQGLPKEKVVAAIVDLLEQTMIRVGNDEYAKENKHFGLTTLRVRHARIEGSEIRFKFKGKSGVEHETELKDRRLARVVKQCQELPGQRLFQYVDKDGHRHDVDSDDVNEYLKEVTGEHFTAKDFRTWAGTVAAAKALALQPAPDSERAAKHAMNVCVKATAGLLGNTPAVCRASYIHPEVLTAFQEHRLPPGFATAEGDAYEAEVLAFLDALSADLTKKTGLSKAKQVKLSAP